VRAASIALGCAALIFAGAAAAQAPSDRAGEPPLVLAKEGYFYVGGVKAPQPGRQLLVDSMFVEYQIPAHRTHPYPLVLVHGGSTTGATFMGTPDDREGWAEYFVRRGYAVYVVDQPTRGRSSYDPQTDGPLESPPPGSAERMFTAPEKFNLWPQAKLHDQYPGTGLPGDPSYTSLTAGQQPSIGGGVRMDTINRDALVALLDKIGPSVILTHSRSGPFGWLVADARPGLVKAIVAVEPNGPAFKNAEGSAANAPPSGSDRDWGITYEKMTFDPPVTDPAQLAPVRDPPEGPDLIGCWRMSGTPHKLPHLAGVPIIIISSEAGYHAQYDQCTSHFLTQAGVTNDYVRLNHLGVHGNGHLMMMEKNNLKIAAVIDDWLRKHDR
jgi:pimeloyl-ACP methyl ester carboxylesterase